MTNPPTGSFRRDPEAALASNPVGLVPLGWDRVPADLPEIARLGYEGIQVDGGDGAGWARALSTHSLRPAEVYLAIPCDVGGPTGEAETVREDRIEYALAAQAEHLVLAVNGNSVRDRISTDRPVFDDEGWERLIALVGTIHDRATDAGIAVSFHPHAGTWVETPDEITQLFALAPDLSLCLDTGHHLLGGGDPVTAISEYGDRLSHLHLKDVDPDVMDRLMTGELSGFSEAVEARIFCPLGSGRLDVRGVVAALDELRYDGWLMVEQDTMWEPAIESSAISRRILEWVCRDHGAHLNRKKT
ncbi:MAG: TIM barrel protein [Acidimicrobiia bacterium]|nr:TIM barrel protein [Acidimicrobiia bacterium]